MPAALADRLLRVQSPVIPLVGQWAAAHPGTISLGQGVVHYPPPADVLQGVESFLSDPLNHRYKPVQGIPDLLALVQEKLARENGIAADPRTQLAVTAGSNMAFVNAILAIADEGDEIILPKPFYFNHEMAVTMLGARPRTVEPGPDMLPTLAAIEAAITARTRAVVTVSPNNPSGVVYPPQLLAAINRLCREREIYHISDETYEYFLYDGAAHFSPGSLPGGEDCTFSLYSLSKAYGFASWRIGYMTLPPQCLAAITKIQDTNLICAPAISQFAALRALEAGRAYCAGRLPSLARVRGRLLAALTALEPFVRVVPAQGAFYVLIELALDQSPLDVVERLIREHRVAVIPGSAFGLEGRCSLRIAYGALREETAQEAIDRLADGLVRLRDDA
jgi:aspartate/methionine/tyrosine aminotransferase